MVQAPRDKYPLRTEIAIYGSAMFWDCGSNVVIPLWLITLDPSPFAFGLVIGARALLPCLLAIPGGRLMDRLGARRVMLAVAAIGLLAPILFPTFAFVWVAGILQLIAGLTTTMIWVGAQTLVSQGLGGHRTYFGRLSFSNRLGALFCPLIAGACWDAFGPWGGFGAMFVGSAILLACVLMLPREAQAEPQAGRTMGLGDWTPKASDYGFALKLLTIPAVMIVVVASILNVATGAIQQSFYVTYLEKIGMTGTLIGILIAAPNILALTGTVWVGWLIRWLGDMRLLNAAVVVSIVSITITPSLESFFVLLVVGLVRGWSQGISQPLMISIPSNAVPPGAQGASVGLRITMNRIVQTLLPPVMGGVVQAIGLENSFYAVGGILLVLVGLSLYLARHVMPPWPDRSALDRNV